MREQPQCEARQALCMNSERLLPDGILGTSSFVFLRVLIGIFGVFAGRYGYFSGLVGVYKCQC